jgi:hypothetical protein
MSVNCLKYKSVSKSGFSANWLYEYRFCTKASVCASVPTEYCTQWTDQREGMGILELQTMPSLHDIANAQPAHVERFCVKFEVRLSLRRSQLFWLHVHLAYVNLHTVLSCPVWLGPSPLWTIQCILYSGTWGNLLLLLYSKWTQLSVMSYTMKGKHGLVL